VTISVSLCVHTVIRLYHIVNILSPYAFASFFNDTASPVIYTLSLHDALPIPPDSSACSGRPATACCQEPRTSNAGGRTWRSTARSEEHTSELQSPDHLVCRLLLEKKKQKQTSYSQSKAKTS